VQLVYLCFKLMVAIPASVATEVGGVSINWNNQSGRKAAPRQAISVEDVTPTLGWFPCYKKAAGNKASSSLSFRDIRPPPLPSTNASHALPPTWLTTFLQLAPPDERSDSTSRQAGRRYSHNHGTTTTI
jgi:hypothetical protein